MHEEAKDRLIRKPELMSMIGLSDSTIWRLEKGGRFPRRIRLGGNAVAWSASEIALWLEQQKAAR